MPRSSVLVNAAAPLRTPTYDGSGQCVHPDVVRVDGAFCNVRYLMVMEPYPYADDALENPSVLGSDDGLTWVVPAGTVNPVVNPPSLSGAWNSDADLAHRRSQVLWLYYRYNSGRGETTLLRTTVGANGDWTAPEPLFTEPVSGRFASPALIEWDGRWHMLSVDTTACTVEVADSADGRCWTARRRLFAFPGAWHVDAVAADGWVYVLLNDRDSLHLLRSRDLARWWIARPGAAAGSAGWAPWAEDVAGRETAWPLLTVSDGGWDNARIYRGTCLVEEGRLRVWYSAQSRHNTWHVGYTEGVLAE